jgi:hypothetical protein
MPPADSTENEITYTPEQIEEHDRREQVAAQRAKKAAKKESIVESEPDRKPRKSQKEH